jgi:hypothetical protein
MPFLRDEDCGGVEDVMVNRHQISARLRPSDFHLHLRFRRDKSARSLRNRLGVWFKQDPFCQGWPASRSSPASESFGLACRAVARSIGTCEERCSARLRCATTRQPSLSTALRAKAGGEDRNRTKSSPTASLNILIYKGILALIFQGLKRFLTLSAHYRT